MNTKYSHMSKSGYLTVYLDTVSEICKSMPMGGKSVEVLQNYKMRSKYTVAYPLYFFDFLSFTL